MSETHSFQAEVKQLLDIVINSLYTDREIFVRELISNASDALEKMRLKQMVEKEIFEADLPLEINISTDDTANTITISDHGIGMTREELTENLGTIAHSGTKAFLKSSQTEGGTPADVIGQFGVGFYSAFMVADRVEVFTHSYQKDGEHLKWESDGTTGYQVEEAPGQKRGSRIVLHLKEEYVEFAKAERIKSIIERYSNFVSFPVNLAGEKLNKVEALWLKSKNEISEEEYKEFYQFTSHAGDDPRYTMHFSADAPIMINALLFVPGDNQEQFGFGQMEAGVSLYCRKVLIDDQPKNLLPEWLRFLRGVIDSEDLPLNISRETMQDSSLIKKLNNLITKRFIKFLDKESKSNPEAFEDFYSRFSRFIKEGIATSFEHQQSLAALLRFESTMSEAGKVTSFQEYQDRMKDGQEEIYYLTGLSRKSIEAKPYLEAFKARGLEVIFFTDQVDEYLMDTLPDVGGKKLVSADRAGIEFDDVDTEGESLSEEDLEALTSWMNKELEEKITRVDAGKRLTSSPMAALAPEDAQSPQVRAMMKNLGEAAPVVKGRLEINPRHDLIKNLNVLRESKPELASKIVSQLADNALLVAGLVDDPSVVASQMNELVADLIS